MPYNTRRKSLSLPSLGIHVPVTHAARMAAAATKSAARPSTSPSPSSTSTPSVTSSATAQRSESPDSPPNKRQKRSRGDSDTSAAQTPPLSPTPATSIEMSDAEPMKPAIDLQTVKDDIVEAVIVQLQQTANRPHLIKELAIVLGQQLTSVQQSANPSAIICSRLASYMKRSCWSATARCPVAKELEPVHPRRTYYFLTTCPRQTLTDSTASPAERASIITPSVSLTDDTGSDYIEGRRRELSPSPEVDLSSPEYDVIEEGVPMPATPMGSYPKPRFRDPRGPRHNSPPLEKDEREFTQTADVLQKRKLSDLAPASEPTERGAAQDPSWLRDDVWFGESRPVSSMMFMSSPAMRPSILPSLRKDEEAESWLKLNKLIEWDKSAESIEIDELDCLLDGC